MAINKAKKTLKEFCMYMAFVSAFIMIGYICLFNHSDAVRSKALHANLVSNDHQKNVHEDTPILFVSNKDEF